jgi:hypothetical protein
VNDAPRGIAKRTVHDVVSGERDKIMSVVAERSTRMCAASACGGRRSVEARGLRA